LKRYTGKTGNDFKLQDRYASRNECNGKSCGHPQDCTLLRVATTGNVSFPFITIYQWRSGNI